ncbi:MAG TPA: hypothetical protein DCM49_00225 [Lachnospiraceae bacterium]|nr:hypothetical protein [Lachnospiraceae bacterium]
MSFVTIIIGIVLFAAATMLIYGWGMYRQMNQSKDLMNLLFSQGVNKVNKYLKKNDSVTEKQVEEMVEGMTAKLPFSSKKSVVADPKEFARRLLDHMVRTGRLSRDGRKYIKTKR